MEETTRPNPRTLTEQDIERIVDKRAFTYLILTADGSRLGNKYARAIEFGGIIGLSKAAMAESAEDAIKIIVKTTKEPVQTGPRVLFREFVEADNVAEAFGISKSRLVGIVSDVIKEIPIGAAESMNSNRQRLLEYSNHLFLRMDK